MSRLWGRRIIGRSGLFDEAECASICATSASYPGAMKGTASPEPRSGTPHLIPTAPRQPADLTLHATEATMPHSDYLRCPPLVLTFWSLKSTGITCCLSRSRSPLLNSALVGFFCFLLGRGMLSRWVKLFVAGRGLVVARWPGALVGPLRHSPIVAEAGMALVGVARVVADLSGVWSRVVAELLRRVLVDPLGKEWACHLCSPWSGAIACSVSHSFYEAIDAAVDVPRRTRGHPSATKH